MAGRCGTSRGSCHPGVVGVVGLGSMGAAIAGRLLETGFEVWVTNRSSAKAKPLRESGAHWTESPRDLAARVPIVLTMVSDDTALDAVMRGEEGLLAGAHRDLVCADMSTVSPDVSARAAAACEDAGVLFLRAPVSGGPSLAATGQLGALVSGPREAHARLRGVLEALAGSEFYLGAGEEARVMKLALNMLIGTTVAGLGEALVLGERWGLDWDSMLDVFTKSAIASPFLKYKAPLLAKREFPPGFTTSLLAKDLGLVIDLARSLEVDISVTEKASDVVDRAMAAGLDELDAVSVVVLLEQLARVREREAMTGVPTEVDG